ncbi:MAG: 8-amino-7-oxononanoate synthase [Dehalococcoidia bacterium]|nr:8-amino-7-oxononanoate synthase [Dehalococcoidia bacterium]
MTHRATGFLDTFLGVLRQKNLHRDLRTIQGPQGPWVEVDGRRVLNLCSNNYLGLASHPQLAEAAATAARTWACGSGASRLVCGNMALHELLERRLADFKRTEAALLYSSGYAANLGIISALVGRGDFVFSDAFNHASIIDGCRLSQAEVIPFPHNDMAALEERLLDGSRSSPRARRLIAVDGVFSMDGDLAPLPQLAELAERYEAMLMVDEAHATGVLGPEGRGVVAHFGLEGNVPIIMGTLSKALGGFGAFAAGSLQLREYLVNTSRSFIFSTALPPPVVASALAALDLLQADPGLPGRLQEKARLFRARLGEMGYDTMSSATQIIPVLVGKIDMALEMSHRLLEEGVLTVAIRPPTVPQGTSRLRVTVTATHSQEDLDFALEAFRKVGRRVGLI